MDPYMEPQDGNAGGIEGRWLLTEVWRHLETSKSNPQQQSRERNTALPCQGYKVLRRDLIFHEAT